MKRILIFICALFMFGACNAATLNFQHNGTTKQIELDTTKRTSPAFAARVDDTVYYANLVETDVCTSGNACVSYGGKTYTVQDNSKYKFTITTTSMPAGTEFSFNMSAAGKFTVDWGDGNVEEIVRANTTTASYTHTYEAAGVHTIKMGGLATGYNTNTETPAISFSLNTNIASISGSLGLIFSTIDDGTASNSQPGFYGTFSGCSRLTSLPPNLFSGVKGSTRAMFRTTFHSCTGLTSIPEDLFVGVTSASVDLFTDTFAYCSGLKSIPSGLFRNMSNIASNTFGYTFRDCTGLTSLPSGLFSKVTGSATYLFSGTFYNCTGLKGTIPYGFFGNPSGTPANKMFEYTFYNCRDLIGPTARMANGTRLYDIMYDGQTWQSRNPNVFYNMYTGTKVADPVADKFTITTTDMDAGTEFSFKMSAKGDFVVDWGDGTTEYIYRPNAYSTLSLSHTYNTAGVRTIKMGGLATQYNIDTTIPAISFIGNTKIAKLSGSLGAIFPTIGNGLAYGSQPGFYQTFAGCAGLTEIPETLFSGVSGAAKSMFDETFHSCTELTELPSGLFSGVSGSAEYMFAGTFYNCTGLTGPIPYGFFGNISSWPSNYMFAGTFARCTNLTGPTALTYDEYNNLIPLYDVRYNGQTWLNLNPNTFNMMYANTGITGVR